MPSGRPILCSEGDRGGEWSQSSGPAPGELTAFQEKQDKAQELTRQDHICRRQSINIPYILSGVWVQERERGPS